MRPGTASTGPVGPGRTQAVPPGQPAATAPVAGAARRMTTARQAQAATGTRGNGSSPGEQPPSHGEGRIDSARHSWTAQEILHREYVQQRAGGASPGEASSSCQCAHRRRVPAQGTPAGGRARAAGERKRPCRCTRAGRSKRDRGMQVGELVGEDQRKPGWRKRLHERRGEQAGCGAECPGAAARRATRRSREAAGSGAHLWQSAAGNAAPMAGSSSTAAERRRRTARRTGPRQMREAKSSSRRASPPAARRKA